MSVSEKKGNGRSPLVTTVIPAYNHESFVQEAIRSALGQTFRDLELIVINDGSTDGTDAVIRSIYREAGERFLYLSKDHEGLVPTLNQGLRMARGKYFLQIGSYDVLHPDAVARQVGRLESRPELGLICGDACIIEGTSKTDRRILGNRGMKYFRSPDMYRELLLHDFIINMTVMYRRERLVEVGGFDENIPWIEDWDAVLRVAERYPIDYIDAPLGYYRLHPTNTHKRLDWMFEGIRATMEKHFRDGRLAHRSWFRRLVFCRIFYYYGKQLYEAGNAREAVQAFKSALGYNPLYLRAYPKLVRAAWNCYTGKPSERTGGEAGTGSHLENRG
jgi:alpha-1,3-rhamnosyltransferase